MSELKKTGYFAGAAIVLAVLAFAFSPSRITPDAFMDQGEQFFPEFSDPNQATSLEVVEFDTVAGGARPFKVTFSGNRWTIPSHHNYPADGKDRLAQTAGIELRNEGGKFIIDQIAFDGAADRQGLGDLDTGEITKVVVSSDSPAKQWMYAPAMFLLVLIVMLQRRRKITEAIA